MENVSRIKDIIPGGDSPRAMAVRDVLVAITGRVGNVQHDLSRIEGHLIEARRTGDLYLLHSGVPAGLDGTRNSRIK